jgi:hypothetical protein
MAGTKEEKGALKVKRFFNQLISKLFLEVLTKVSIRLIVDAIRNILKAWTCRPLRQFFFPELYDQLH